MHITRKHALLVAALGALTLVLLSGAGASGCDNSKGGTGQGGTQVGATHLACVTKVIKKVQRIGRSRTMEAETNSSCDTPPIAHVVLITLAYHPDITNGKGKAPDFVTMGTKFCNAKPVPGIDTPCHVTLEGVCHVGIWRITVLITGTSPNGTPFSFPLPKARGGGAKTKITSCA